MTDPSENINQYPHSYLKEKKIKSYRKQLNSYKLFFTHV